MAIVVYSEFTREMACILSPAYNRSPPRRLVSCRRFVMREQRAIVAIIQDGQGQARDDASKKHPCLVPYADLPESEKEYDRKTADETLKAIMVLGYKIGEPG